jgi:hypothetical protein
MHTTNWPMWYAVANIRTYQPRSKGKQEIVCKLQKLNFTAMCASAKLLLTQVAPRLTTRQPTQRIGMLLIPKLAVAMGRLVKQPNTKRCKIQIHGNALFSACSRLVIAAILKHRSLWKTEPRRLQRYRIVPLHFLPIAIINLTYNQDQFDRIIQLDLSNFCW